MRKCSAMLLAALAFCAAQSFAETHTVTFRRMNGTVLSKVEVEHGANATSLVPAGPDESANDLSFSRWDFVDKLACVTNDVTCWALYEATAAKSPSTSIQSKPVVDRGLPYSLDEYFQMYDNLAWSDEFSGTSLDTGRKYSYWGQTYYQGSTWRYIIDHTNNELQQYTEGDNVTLSNGILKITARRETRGDYKFTSAKIATDGCVYVKYGRCEIRAKLTKQQGTWPAFWMIRNDPSHGFYSELDIMEQINGYDWIGGCFHRDIRNSTSEQHKTDSNSAVACTEDGTGWGDEFHRIGAIFNEFEIIWYVDDHIFKRLDVRNRDRYRVYHEHSWYVLLNLAFGGWAGEEFPDGNDDPRIANFLSEDYEIDYCRIYTNTTTDNTVQREAEPAGARLSGPVKATVWRGWQMNWAKPGSNYYMDHLIGSEAVHIKTALSEYVARDKPDIVTFLSKPTEHTDEYDKVMSYDIPGVSTVFLSPDQGANNEPGYFGTTRERLLSGVMFNKERFSTSRSAISSLPISNDADFTNCCAVVAELVEKDSGAKVKVVSVNVIRTNGVDNASGVEGQAFSTLMSKLDAMKDEKVILFLQGESWNNLSYIDNRVKTELRPSFSKLGQFTSAWPANQSAWVTANYAASAENPAPLSVPKSNGKPSGVHTNQAYCATVQFEAPEPEPAIEYGQLDMSGFAKKMTVTFSGAQSGTTLTDFPVLVKLSTAISGFSYADFSRPNGGDLRFADASGNLLPHEIDTWNENGVSAVWVKVPQLAKDTAITAHYGYTGSGDPAEVDPKDVWDSNYVGVWHLGESALPMAESTGVSTPFASKTGTASYGAAGAVGGSVDFTAAKGTESFLTAADDDDLDGFDDFTVEMWTCQDTFYNANEAYAGTIVKRNARADNESWFTYQDKATRKPGIAYGNDAAASDRTLALANTLPAAGEWTHQAFVRTVSTSKVVAFMDGTNNSTTVKSSGAVFAGSAPLMLGGGGGQMSFPGRIDEVRISKVARSAAWVKATHDTIANASFATYTLRGAPSSGYAAWIAGKGLTGAAAAFEKETNGIKNGIRYAFDIDPSVATVGDPIIKVVRDANGNPSVQSRELATGRDDVTFGILATESLTDWTTPISMEKFSDGFWKPTASKASGYVFPSQMFFKYMIDIQ